jgi:DNA-binding NarL/FixJ family response regulator
MSDRDRHPQAGRDPASPLRVIVAAGDARSRGALAAAVRAPGGTVVVAQAGDAVEALELVAHYRPDVLLCREVLLADAEFALARQLRDDHPDVAVVLLAPDGGAQEPLEALRAGVTSIVDEATDPEALVAALRASADGDALIDPTVTRQLIEEVRMIPAPGSGFRPIRSNLSNREWQILGMMSDGASPKEIAQALTLSQDTVYTHTRNILRKLGVGSREEAILAAREHYGPQPR